MIYLDNSATTRPFDSVLDIVAESMREGYFNPSSLYAPAMRAEKALDDAKNAVKAALGTKDGKVVLTSGGTESDNLAIIGAALSRRARKGHFLYGAAEHPAVKRAMEAVCAMGHEVQAVPVDVKGIIKAGALEEMLRADTVLVSIQHVNNEVGAVQPLAELADAVRKKCPDALFHSDGVQAFLRVPLAMCGIDLYAVSAHKIHGPRGVGALWVGPRARLVPILHGGGQQDNLRSGTENTPGAVGLRAAIDGFAEMDDAVKRMMELKLRLYQRIMDALPDAAINGPPPEAAAPHILNMSFGVKGEVLLHALEGEGILVSTGSACSSRKPSETLTAMGASRDRIEGAIRFSLSPMTTVEEIDQAAETLARLVPAYRAFRRK